MNTIYETLKEKIDEFGELKIEVFYSLGGMNYFSGTVSRRGIYLLCKPISRGNGFESSIMMGDQRRSGFKFLLMEQNRKNQKKIDECFAKVSQITNTIAELYEAEKYDALVDLVRSYIPLEKSVNPVKIEEKPMPKMKLLTKELLERFAKIGSQQDETNPLVIAKFFNPTGAGTWYATEYNPADKIFYGYVKLHEGEWGSFGLEELESVTGAMGLGIERDRNFKEKRFSEINIKQFIN